jgi:acyl-CoA synthetase (AMP-forming)/AMP-acid ligase II
MRQLTAWLENAATDRGIRFATRDGWDCWTYRRLAQHARRVAAALCAAGVRAGDRVVLVQPTGPCFVGPFFGTMLAGATPVPAAPPIAFQQRGQYADQLGAVLRGSRPALVVTETALAGEVAAVAAGCGGIRVVTLAALLDGVGEEAEPPARPPAEHALVQFTSGSGGHGKGVPVSFPALDATIDAIGSWLRHTSADPTASWLPPYHDMGLVGCLLTPVAHQADLWLMDPQDFVRSPLRYLRCFGAGGARLTAMPTFGLAHIVRRVRPGDLAGLDFREWRAVIVGAERVTADVLESFTALLAPHGFAAEALLPAYGLAEATLVVSGVRLERRWRELPAAATSLAPGRPVVVAAAGEPVQRLVGCGPPMPGLAVSVVDEGGAELPAGHVGEITVAGRSVGDGYLGGADASVTRWVGDRLHTGDAGFLHDGELFVLGRLGDSLKVRGRTLFAEDLEAVAAAAGLPARRVAALLGVRDGRPEAVLVVERPPAGALDGVPEQLRLAAEGAAVSVHDVPVGAIPRTSSGKPRRRLLWRAYATGVGPFSGAPDAPCPPCEQSRPAH